MDTICLVTPPSVFLLDERMFPNLGILRVASSLERAGRSVEHLDLSGYKNYAHAAAHHAAQSKATIFGITATSPQLPAAVEIASALRSVNKDAKVILGGPHPTFVYAGKHYEEAKKRKSRAHRAAERLESLFDVIVAGDGEEAIHLACEKGAPQVIDADGFKGADGKRNTLFLTQTQLEDSAYPARHLIDLESYDFKIDGVRASSLIAQLGCPFDCGFCAGRNSPMARHIRTRSAEHIVEEMVHMYRLYGIRGFMFYDDELNLVDDEFVKLCQMISKAQRDLGTTWKLRGNVKSQLFNETQAEAMREAGFRKLLIGFESGSPRILSNIRKRATQENNTRCLDIARKYHMEVKALMSIGHPGESRETIEESRRWLLDTKPAEADFTIITPYPGSNYYDHAVEAEGMSVEGKQAFVYTCRDKFGGSEADKLYSYELDYVTESDYYKGDPNALVISHVFTKHLSAEDIVEERKKLETVTREKLGIPYHRTTEPVDYDAVNFGHSMGQTPILPGRMLRVSQPAPFLLEAGA